VDKRERKRQVHEFTDTEGRIVGRGLGRNVFVFNYWPIGCFKKLHFICVMDNGKSSL
jgi:hypothetical protein